MSDRLRVLVRLASLSRRRFKNVVKEVAKIRSQKGGFAAAVKKLVKEKFFLEARSGHLSDSVTSSLTAFTTPSSDSSEGKSSTSSDCQEQKDRKKRKKNKEETKKGSGNATSDNKKKIRHF